MQLMPIDYLLVFHLLVPLQVNATYYLLIVQTLMLRDVTDCCHRNNVMNRLTSYNPRLDIAMLLCHQLHEREFRSEQRRRLGGGGYYCCHSFYWRTVLISCTPCWLRDKEIDRRCEHEMTMYHLLPLILKILISGFFLLHPKQEMLNIKRQISYLQTPVAIFFLFGSKDRKQQ